MLPWSDARDPERINGIALIELLGRLGIDRGFGVPLGRIVPEKCCLAVEPGGEGAHLAPLRGIHLKPLCTLFRCHNRVWVVG